jgi:hypothetical protein
MTISHKSLYLLVNAAVLTASAIELVRGYRLLVVIVCALCFCIVGNLTVWLKGSRQRAAARERKRAYYAGQ